MQDFYQTIKQLIFELLLLIIKHFHWGSSISVIHTLMILLINAAPQAVGCTLKESEGLCSWI